jgi:hypothetical protein
MFEGRLITQAVIQAVEFIATKQWVDNNAPFEARCISATRLRSIFDMPNEKAADHFWQRLFLIYTNGNQPGQPAPIFQVS